MSKKVVIFPLVLILMIGLAACGGTTPTQTTSQNATEAPTAAGPDADSDGIPDNAENLLGTDPNNADTDGDSTNDIQDAEPTRGDNPIEESSTTVGFTIDRMLIEDNENPEGPDDPDHLELMVTNVSDSEITNFDIYYTITDPTTSTAQSYYRTLPNFTLAPNETKDIHFINTDNPEHFSVNPNSAYYTSLNQVVVEVMLHAEGFAPQTARETKDAGGGASGPED